MSSHARIERRDVERVVTATMKILDEYDVPYGTVTNEELSNKVYDELNTKTTASIPAVVVAVGNKFAVVEFSDDGRNRRKNEREDIPLEFCPKGLKDEAIGFAEFRSNASWGRWYFVFMSGRTEVSAS